MREHHLGIVVNNIEESQKIFANLGYQACSKLVVDVYQHNKILFLESYIDMRRIELIEALDDDSTVKNFKPGFHHICFEVGNADDFGKVFKDMGIGKIFTRELVAPAIDNRSIMFACLKNGLFVEFLMGGSADEGSMHSS